MLDYVLWPVGKTFAKVDRADIDLVANRSWYLSTNGYAIANAESGVRGVPMLRMHRHILGASAVGQIVDHANRDRLDNRRQNLRVTDATGNARNRTAKRGIPKGVRRDGNKWEARIGHQGLCMSLGRFSTAEHALLAYNEAAARLHGQFACLNVIPTKVA